MTEDIFYFSLTQNLPGVLAVVYFYSLENGCMEATPVRCYVPPGPDPHRIVAPPNHHVLTISLNARHCNSHFEFLQDTLAQSDHQPPIIRNTNQWFGIEVTGEFQPRGIELYVYDVGQYADELPPNRAASNRAMK